MGRVTVAELSEIYKGSTNAVSLQSMIDTANLLVTEELTIVTPALSIERLKRIELYLAAHLATVTFEAGGLLRKKMDTVEEEYQQQAANLKGLQSTRFGQQVILLDPSGRLGSLSTSANRASFRMITPASRDIALKPTEFE